MPSKIGKYSGNERLDPSTMEEPDADNEFTRKMWLEDVFEDPEFLDDVKEQVDEFKKIISMTTDPDKIIIHQVGQSHIDVAWKWRYEQTRQKAIKTFRKAVIHARKFPNKFNFALSEPLLLEWVKEDDPELFKDIQETVKKGGIELVGGSYVEPDCMMPSGEAFVRERLYGQRFYKEHFGKLAEVEWFLDSFGYNWGLPQILKKSGAKAFWTSKITWNRQTLFPFVNFWWEGPDGTRLLTSNFKMGMGPISSWMMNEIGRHPLKKDGRKVWDYTINYEDIDEHVEEDEICPHVGCFFGKGDGGHGPTHQEVAVAEAWEKLGFTKWSSVGNFFDEIRKWGDRIPVWRDELYLEYHRGTFSVHSEVKRHNRLYENALTSLETLSLITTLTNPDGEFQYPFESIEHMWKIVLLNQFHDVLPGSSIPEVYDDVYDYWVELDKTIENIKSKIGKALSNNKNEKDNDANNVFETILFNPVSWDREFPVFIPITAAPIKIDLDENGKPPYGLLNIVDAEENYICQPVSAEPEDSAYPRPAGWWVVPKLKALSSTKVVIKLVKESEIGNAKTNITISDGKNGDEPSISNGVISVKLSPNTGGIKELKSKEVNDNKNLVVGEESNLFYGFLDDYPHDHAWNIKPQYWNYPLDDIKNDEDVKISIGEEGPVFSSLVISRTLGKDKSQVTQKIVLFKELPYIFMEYSTNWKQPFVMLKILYKTATDAQWVTADGAYCSIKSKTQPETPCDKARYEKIMHKYCDLYTEDKSWGFALINEGKYAFDTMGDPGNLRLTLLRSPRYPTPAGEAWVNKERYINKEKYNHTVPEFSGLGPEKCRYMLYPHKGSTFEFADGTSNPFVKRAAEEFNQPVLVIPVPSGQIEPENQKLTYQEPILTIETPNVFLGALKKNEWEKSGSIIIRVVEGCGFDSNAKIVLSEALRRQVHSIRAVDLIERPIEDTFDYNKDTGELTFSIGKFEIKTFEII